MREDLFVPNCCVIVRLDNQEGLDLQKKRPRMQGRGDLLDEKVGSILTDLGYTKTRHHDKYVGG